MLIRYIMCKQKGKTKTSFWRQAVINASTQLQRQKLFYITNEKPCLTKKKKIIIEEGDFVYEM